MYQAFPWGAQDVLEQSCAGIGSSDVVVLLIELGAGATLCEASGVRPGHWWSRRHVSASGCLGLC